MDRLRRLVRVCALKIYGNMKKCVGENIVDYKTIYPPAISEVGQVYNALLRHLV